MSKDISIKAGANLNLKGLASTELEVAKISLDYALNPDDFFGLIPRMLVKEGDKVSLGQPIFHDKNNESIKIVSPVNGKILEIVRGAKRKILNVIIRKEGDTSINYKIPNLSSISKDKIMELLVESGSLAYIKQRPYNIIAKPDRLPKSIFVSIHSTAPYAADYDFILKNRMDEFQNGVNVMSKLIGKPINLSISYNCESDFSILNNVELYKIKGAHPSGNESFQINRIDPLNSGEIIWVIKPEDLANIGSFFITGIFNPRRTVAVSGESLRSPKYYDTIIGSSISSLIDSKELSSIEDYRFINGDPLSGSKVEYSDFLGYYNNALSVIKEGNQYRMLGWLPFIYNSVPSLSKTSLSWLLGGQKKVNTNLNGEERAIVVTGEMEKYFPMDIFPMQLIKACMTRDIEKMESLGIYEVVPEDFGLVDFSCTSKIEAQEIVKSGIQIMLKEVG
jgi:Na+-transporting NADH:ubiquinone oxidoreductase subunit A